MKSKFTIVIIMIITTCVFFNGCFLKNVTTDMTEKPQNSVYGAWYDDSNMTFLELKHDGSYTFGYGKYNTNSGGVFTVDDQQIILKTEYVVVDGKKQTIPQTEKEDMILPYSFSLDGNLKIKTSNISLDLTSIPINGISETTLTTLSGYWLNVAVKESMRFDSSGNYTKTLENGSIEKGTYQIDDGTLKITINGETKSYEIYNESKDRFTIKIDGKTSTFERMGE